MRKPFQTLILTVSALLLTVESTLTAFIVRRLQSRQSYFFRCFPGFNACCCSKKTTSRTFGNQAKMMQSTL